MTKNMMLKAVIATGFSLCVAACSDSHTDTQVFGHLSASIHEQEYSGVTLFVPLEKAATAEYRDVGSIVMVNIQGHLPATDNLARNVINLELSLSGSDASAEVSDASVTYWPEDMHSGFYLSEDTDKPVTVTLSKLNLDDNPSIAGSFEGIMCRKESFFSEIDMTDCLPVKGRFDTRLWPQSIGE